MYIVAQFFSLAAFTLCGLAILVAGAEALVRGGSSIGLRFGLTPLFIGLTIVACGTSAPELVVSISAALKGKGDISIANVVGSNIFNISVILGITALLMPIRIHLQVIKIDIPIMIGISLLGIGCIASGPLTVIHGLLLVSLLIAYMSFTYIMARREQQRCEVIAVTEVHPQSSRSVLLDLLFVGGGVALMVEGSNLLVDSAVSIASLLGVSEAVIGLTLVATGTSLPELATSIVATYRKSPEVAVGNVVGSNIFNILGILGTTALVTPLSAPGVRSVDLAVMLLATLMLLPLAISGKILSRWEGLLLLLGYGGYLWWLWP